VRYMHDQGILHRDIAPDNLILRSDNQVTLIDFGAADADFEGSRQPSIKVLAVKDGFSPYEFYVRDQTQSLCSDLYSLAATFYFLITGTAPPDCQARVHAVAAGKPDPYQPLLHKIRDHDPRILETIDLALSLDQRDRVQSAEEWIARLDGPMPVKKHRFDPKLAQKISDLVTSTNTTLKQDKTGKLQGSIAAVEALSKPSKPKQFVDIFGNPIKDVDAFLREQDRLCELEKLAREAQTETVEESVRQQSTVQNPVPSQPVDCSEFMRDAEDKPSVSVFGKVIARFKTNKRGSDTGLLHT
jgi:serine/threonine protein kinase